MLAAETLDGLIVKNPEIHNGRPVIAGTGTTVRAIAIMVKREGRASGHGRTSFHIALIPS
jgi:uncharacterized protein (DUF433 family)